MDIPTIPLITGIAAFLSAIGAIAAAMIAFFQLRKMVHQLNLQNDSIKSQSKAIILRGEREKKWQTVKACQRYTSDPNICKATKEIWDMSNMGTDYTNIMDPPQSLYIFLNYLESICIGIEQGIYDKKIVFDNHNDTFFKAKKVFFDGESGNYRGTEWRATKSLVSEDEYPHFLNVCNEWFGENNTVKYRDPETN